MDNRYIIAFIIGGLLVAGAGFAVQESAETTTAYEYDVKTEQVSGETTSAAPISELDPVVSDAIFDAWKRSDHFLGGASVTIRTDDALDLTEEARWRVISIDGATVLVGISGPQEFNRASWESALAAAIVTLGGMLSIIGIVNLGFKWYAGVPDYREQLAVKAETSDEDSRFEGEDV